MSEQRTLKGEIVADHLAELTEAFGARSGLRSVTVCVSARSPAVGGRAKRKKWE